MTTDHRLARVERQCRLFKAGFALMTVALAVVLLIGAGQDRDKTKVLEEVRAKRFVVVDDKGVVRVRMGLGPNGGGFLRFLDKDGSANVDLGTQSRGGAPYISLRGGGENAASCSIGVGDTARFWMFQNGERCLYLTASGFTFADKYPGQPRFSFIRSTNGMRLFFYKKAGLSHEPSIVLGVDGEDSPSLRMYDEKGGVIFEAP